MLRRLYYVFPDYDNTRHVVDELLLHRVNIKHMHVVTNDANKVTGLPEASIFQRYDIRHSIVVGLIIGGILGVVVGVIAHQVLNLVFGGFMVVMTIGGMLLGAWFSSMVGMMTPNSELKPFQQELDKGLYLLLVDVPQHSVKSVDDLIKHLHPEARAQGPEPTFPSFP